MSVATISARELLAKAKAGETIDLIDVRTPVEFREVHVTFAQNLPLESLDAPKIARERKNKNQPTYVICNKGGRGAQAAQQLLAAGLADVVNVEGGTTACVEAGVPCERGKKAVSLERQVRIAAGSLVFGGAVLAWTVHPAFLGVCAFVGAGLVFSGITDTCGMALVLARMPWNQVKQSAGIACAH